MHKSTLGLIYFSRTYRGSSGSPITTYGHDLPIIATIDIGLPDADQYGQDILAKGMLEAGKVAAALIGILIIVMAFKAFWRG
jgi:V8-like Glu-specific endopeptidase